MNTHIETQGFDLTPAIDAWVREQLDAELSRFDRDIRRVEFQLGTAHGPEGGRGMSAGLTVHLKHRAPVRITTVHADLYCAIAVTVKRAEKAILRTIGKRRRWQRSLLRRARYESALTSPV